MGAHSTHSYEVVGLRLPGSAHLHSRSGTRWPLEDPGRLARTDGECFLRSPASLTVPADQGAKLRQDPPRELREGTSGTPLSGNYLRIVDPETGEELAAGEHGEIAVKGYTLMRGYYKVEPERSFYVDGYFHTQDGGFVDADGNLHWTGRISTMTKMGGANVSPLEIESALEDYEPLPVGIPVGVPHPSLDEAVVLCAVRREDFVSVGEDEIRAHLRERLAAYKVPKRVLFFSADERPTRPTRRSSQRRCATRRSSV